MSPKQKQLEITIQPLLDQIAQHRLFPAITSIEKLSRFAECHVYVVWDFMCLLKALQRRLTHLNQLWLPPHNYLGCFLVNHMVAEEESDQLSDGRYISHFDLYLEAMQQCGADTTAVLQFLADIRQHFPIYKLLRKNYMPDAARHFVSDTFALIDKATHIIAASFAYARESITTDMFTPILKQIQCSQQTQNLSKFIEYFQRHIDLDSGKHSNQARLLVASLCENDEQKWQEATGAAEFSLNSRLRFLDLIAEKLGC